MARREEILDALIGIFREDGVSSDFTISQLAKQVNIGKSTIYEYFDTKEDIVQQAVARVVEQAHEQIVNEPIEETIFEEMFIKELGRLFNIAQGSRFLFNLVTPHDRKMLSEECKQSVQGNIEKVKHYLLGRFESIFMKGVEEGVLNPQGLMEYQLVISSIVIGNIVQLANGREEKTSNIDVEDLINKVYRAIVKIVN